MKDSIEFGGKSNENKYLYNGKELQDEQLGGINLDFYDYGAKTRGVFRYSQHGQDINQKVHVPRS